MDIFRRKKKRLKNMFGCPKKIVCLHKTFESERLVLVGECESVYSRRSSRSHCFDQFQMVKSLATAGWPRNPLKGMTS